MAGASAVAGREEVAIVVIAVGGAYRTTPCAVESSAMGVDLRDILPSGILDAAPTIRLRDGAYLFHQSDSVNAIYYVKSGQVGLRRRLPDGSFVVNQMAAPGEILAEAALFTEAHHCDAIATMQSQVMALTKTAMLNLLGQDSSVALAWMRHLSSQVRDFVNGSKSVISDQLAAGSAPGSPRMTVRRLHLIGR